MRSRKAFVGIIISLIFWGSAALAACAPPSPTPTKTPPPLPATETKLPPTATISPTAFPAATETADIIFHNGLILTMEDDQPSAQAIAIKGEKILAVGADDDILALGGAQTQVIDLQGRTLQPGFIDPHTHILTDMGGIETGQKLALENGFTSVTDASIEPGLETDFFDASQSGLLRLRTTLYLVRSDVCGNDVGIWYEKYPLDTTVGERVRIGGVKIFADGGACGKVAASQTFLEGYENGQPFHDLETLTEMIRTADAAGYQVIIHAQGDLAIAEALDAYAAVLDSRPNILRHRIEHNVLQTEQTIHRYSELGIIPTLFGSSEACRTDLPWTDFYKNNGERPGDIIAANPGLVIAWHGDDPWQTPVSPIYEYYSLVTRGRVEEDGAICPPADWQKGAEVERSMALKMMTINAAYAIRQEKLVGSLVPGKYADLVILSGNLLTAPAETIPDIRTLATIISGKTEFCADENAGYCPQTVADASSATETADIIFHNGVILTVEDEQPSAQAIAIKEEKILAVGANDDILAFGGAQTRVVDLAGRTLLPGFIDGHTHILAFSLRTGKATLDEAQDIALRFGFTSVTEMWADDTILAELRQAEETGKLRLRVNIFPSYHDGILQDGKKVFLRTWYPANDPILDSDRMLRIPGIKVFVDGAGGGGRGCPALSEPYEPDFVATDWFKNSCGSDRGDLYWSQEELNQVVADAQAAGYRVAFHVMGDQGAETALNAIEFALDGQPNERYRHQIQHNSVIRPDQIERYIDLDILASLRGYFNTCEQNDYITYHGPDRYEWNANRYTLPGLGVHAFFETDFGWTTDPADTYSSRNPNSLLQLYGLVTRQQVNRDGVICEPESWLAPHAISVEQALRTMTIEPAYAVSQEDVVGTLAPGKYADLIILSDNPMTVDPNAIKDMEVWMTMVGGRVEFCADGRADLCPQAEAGASSATETGSTSPSGNSASASTSSDPLENAFDGDLDTIWNSGGDAPQWIEIDLGEARTVAGIRLIVAQYPNGYTLHRVLGKSPDGDYQLLYEFSGDTDDLQELRYFPSSPWSNIRFVKVETLQSPSWVAWKEIIIETPEP